MQSGLSPTGDLRTGSAGVRLLLATLAPHIGALVECWLLHFQSSSLLMSRASSGGWIRVGGLN